MRDTTQLDHVDPDILALFAMKALEGEEYELVRTHVDGCPQCRREVQRATGDLALLAMGASEMLTPPAQVKTRLMAEVGRAERERAVSSRRPGVSGFWRWAFALSSALALVLAAVVWNQRGEVGVLRRSLAGTAASLEQERTQSAEAREIVDLLKASGSVRLTLVSSKSRPEPVAHTTFDPHRGRVLVVASNLEALPAEKTYELWLLPRSGAPIPAGLFRPDPNGNAQLFYSGLAPGQEAKGFAVTVEPQQGSPAPTTTPLLVGIAGA